MSQSVPLHNQSLTSMLELEYPQPIGVFRTYAEAQQAIDYLADQEFPVKNIALVGTDLRLLERVTGRRTWGTTLWAGVQSGISTGLLIALLMFFMNPGTDFFSMLLIATGVGIVIGVVFQVIAYAVGRGKRDFTSITQTVATNYELLCEHKVAAQARELLAKRPGARASQFDPRFQPPMGAGPVGQGQMGQGPGGQAPGGQAPGGQAPGGQAPGGHWSAGQQPPAGQGSYQPQHAQPPYPPQQPYPSDASQPPYPPQQPYPSDASQPPYPPQQPYPSDASQPPYPPQASYPGQPTAPEASQTSQAGQGPQGPWGAPSASWPQQPAPGTWPAPDAGRASQEFDPRNPKRPDDGRPGAETEGSEETS